MAAAAIPIAGAVIGGMINKKMSGGTQTVQQTADPWVGAQPGLNALYGNAVNNFYEGGPEYYPNQTFAAPSQTTTQAMDAMYQRALQGSPVLSGAQDMVNRTNAGEYLYSNPALAGLNDASNFDAMGMEGMGMLDSIGNGYGQGMTEGLQGLAEIGGGSQLGTTMGLSDLQRIGSGANVGRTAGTQQLAAIGNGSMLNANPYVDEMFANASRGVGQQFANNVMPGIASMFAGAGRYGSEAMQSGLSDAQNNYGDVLNRLGTDIYGQNYANERQLQQQALNQIGQVNLAERGQQLQGLNSLGQFSQNEKAQQIQSLLGAGQLSTAERNQMLSALQSLTSNQLAGQGLRQQALGEMSSSHGRERAMQMQAAGMAPALAQADYFDLDRMLGIGQMQDAFTQKQIDADIARWDFNQNQNNNSLAFLSQIMNGAAPYRSGTTSSQQPGNFMNGAMGGMMMGGQMMPLFNGQASGMSGMGNINPYSGEFMGSLEF